MIKSVYLKPETYRIDIENDPVMAPAGCEDLENFFNASGQLTGSTRTFTLQCGGGGNGAGNLHAHLRGRTPGRDNGYLWGD